MEMDSRQTTPGGGRTAARRVACVRCRRRKKRCDHVVPVCGECKRTGAECVQIGRRSSGAFTTVPTAYIRQLEGIAGRDDQDQAGHVTLDIAEHSRSPEDDHFDGSCGRDVTENSDQSSPHDIQNHLNDPVRSTAGQSSYLTTSSPQTRDSSVPECVPSVAELGQDPRSLQGRADYLPEIEPLRSQDITISSMERQVLRPLSDIVIFIGEDWMDHYANVYFQHIQPQWSFLDEDVWREAYDTWKRNPSKVESVESFIIQLALAVGALACSSFRMDCQHSAHATKLHDGAIRNHFIHTTQHPLALKRTQSSLLNLLYAFHSPSPAGIPGGIMLVLMNCASLVEEHDEAGYPQCLNANYEYMRHHAIMSCHIINEVVLSAWTYDRTFTFEFLDDRLYQYVSRLTLKQRDYGFFEHLFRLRCIQSKIRHNSKKLQQLDSNDPFRQVCRSRLTNELHRWKSNIQLVASSSPADNLVYHNPISLSKLYDYSLSVLMQEQPNLMGVDEIGHLVESCSEACRTFQLSQENDVLMYWTWSSLLYQFRLGILLLYCYFITVPTMRTPIFNLPETLLGIKSCYRNLAGFSIRWSRAGIFLQAYQLLAEGTFKGIIFEHTCNATDVDPTSLQTQSAPYLLEGNRKSEMEKVLDELRLQHVHQAVLVLINEMVHKPRAEDVDYDRVQFAPDMSLNGVDLFSF